MTDDLSALREEVARAAETSAEPWLDDDTEAKWFARVMLAVVFSDPDRLLRVLADQPCPDCGGTRSNPPAHGQAGIFTRCESCSGSGRLDLVSLLVENGTLAETAIDRDGMPMDAVTSEPLQALTELFRRSSVGGEKDAPHT